MLDQQLYNKIRLKPEYLTAIITAFQDHFLPTDHLWIFGSRVDLNERGGDIDLYIETKETDAEIVIQRRVKFVGAIWKKVGEQKIDVVINLTVDKLELPIYNVALKYGVQLV